MAWDDEELRKEALMRMAMPDLGMQQVEFVDDPEAAARFGQQRKEDLARDYMRSQDPRSTSPFAGSLEDYTKFRDSSDANKQPPPQAPKGYLDKAAEGLYDMLPGAAGTKAGLDPLLKRKGLGR